MRSATPMVTLERCGATRSRKPGARSLGAAASVLLGLVLSLAGAPSQQAMAEAGVATPTWLGVPDGDAHTAVAELEARLVRRQGGEWVIVSLAPRGAGGPAELAPPASPAASDGGAVADLSDYVAVQSTLHEYERAIEKRDAARLSQVWMMNPAEQAHFQYLFDESRSISVSIEDSDIDLDGDRASMRFAQRFVVSRRGDAPRGFKRRSYRALFASDAAGSWDIDAVLEK